MARKKNTAPAVRLGLPADYLDFLESLKERVRQAQTTAMLSVNREWVLLYWDIGRRIVEQQESAKWGDAVVERLARDLRLAFPDMKGLSLPNVWKMRQFFRACREIGRWLRPGPEAPEAKVGELSRQLPQPPDNLSTVSSELGSGTSGREILSTLSRELTSPEFAELVPRLSWSQHTEILTAIRITREFGWGFESLRMAGAGKFVLQGPAPADADSRLQRL
ncbi:MAG: hypothetical protein HYU36_01810, partial [Planctomycetes bacterium]|nr:hypothetical protein [Planctomycetota bacterium]